jgi:hypothetical protein
LVVQIIWEAEAEIRLSAVIRAPLRKPSEQKELKDGAMLRLSDSRCQSPKAIWGGQKPVLKAG